MRMVSISSNLNGWNYSMPVIIAANRLPIQMKRRKIKDNLPSADTPTEWDIQWAGDRIIEGQNTFSHSEITQKANIIFVGCIPDIEINEQEQEELQMKLMELNCCPVFLTTEERKLYYEDYCKGVLWPVFHNIVDVYSPIEVVLESTKEQKNISQNSWNPTCHKQAWQAYANVNQKFANIIASLYEPGHVIWIHDYHLLLTPSFLIRKLQAAANIGLFLHVPFPSSEVFRTLSSRKEILRGMLNADHVGFHLFEHARHFMSACKRILGLQWTDMLLRGQLGVDYGGRRVHITCSHMAVDVNNIEKKLASNELKESIALLYRKYTGRRIIIGCDAVERLKGIPIKLLAFEALLDRCPELISKIILVQKGIHRRGRAVDYLQSKREIEHIVEAINNKYRTRANGHNVVDYEELQHITFAERIALWRVADVQITTVLRDGLNTAPFEYIAAHHISAGVVIVSEFSGSSKFLNGAIVINPWELDQVIDALRDAVYMSSAQREHRRKLDFQYVFSNPPRRWATGVLSDIVNARKKEQNNVYMGTGFGLDFRLVEVNASFRKLTSKELIPSYKNGKFRAIFLDYYRTLVPDVSGVPGVRWPELTVDALAILEQLCKDPRNRVYIISGCSVDVLGDRFGSVPGLGLVAEHGYFIRKPLFGNDARLIKDWESTCDISCTKETTKQWRERATKIIKYYVDRTTGATLETRQSSVLFRYANSDFEFGALQAAELRDHLEEVFHGWPLNILQGKDYIEIRPEGIGKGKAIEKILQRMQREGNSADFVFCAGDDIADEEMFEKLESVIENCQYKLTKDDIFSCTVGQKPSKAAFYVDDYQEVIDLLKSLHIISTKSNRNYSLSDMNALLRQQQEGRGILPAASVNGAIIRKSASRQKMLRSALTTVAEEDYLDIGNKAVSNTTEVLSPNGKVGLLSWFIHRSWHEKAILFTAIVSFLISKCRWLNSSKTHKRMFDLAYYIKGYPRTSSFILCIAISTLYFRYHKQTDRSKVGEQKID